MKKKIISLIIVLSLCLPALPVGTIASAADLCEHHTEHVDCGYIEGESPCGYSCAECVAEAVAVRLSGEQPTDPVEPVCTCETKCAEDAINAGCEACAADLAVCDGESAIDLAVVAVRELIAALPGAEALAAMSTEEQNQAYDALLAADDAYQALKEEQKGQLAEENAKLDALFAYFNNPNMTVPAAIPTVVSYDIYANGTPLLIVAYGEGTAIYIDTDGDGVKDDDEKSLQEAGVVDENRFSDGSTSYQYCTIYGGSKDGAVASTRITMTGGTVEFIYGGSGAGGSVTGNTEVIIKGGSVRASVYGGGKQSSVGGKASVTVSGGTVGFDYNGHGVYGGGDGDQSSVGSAEVTITGGTAGIIDDNFGDVYGGGNNGGSVTGTAKVTITGGTVKNIYGGGAGGSVGSTEVLIGADATVGEEFNDSLYDGTVYGGGYGGSVTGTASVTIKDAVTVSYGMMGISSGGTVYYGGNGGTVGSAHVKCENGSANKITFDAGICRTASDGDFQSAAAGETTPPPRLSENSLLLFANHIILCFWCKFICISCGWFCPIFSFRTVSPKVTLSM